MHTVHWSRSPESQSPTHVTFQVLIIFRLSVLNGCATKMISMVNIAHARPRAAVTHRMSHKCLANKMIITNDNCANIRSVFAPLQSPLPFFRQSTLNVVVGGAVAYAHILITYLV